MSSLLEAVKKVDEFTLTGQLVIDKTNIDAVIEGLDTMGYTVVKSDQLQEWAEDILENRFGMTVFDADSESSFSAMIENLTDWQKEDAVDKCISDLAKPFMVHANTNSNGHTSIVDEDTTEVLEELHRIHGFKLAEILRTLL